MGKLKIKFHPLFALYIFVCIYFNWFNKIFFYVITVTLHEYGHYMLSKHYGYKIDGLIYSLSGAGISTNEKFKEKDEIIIAIAGPLVNVFIILICVCFWWIFPLSYLYTYDFLICNIMVLIFNILPIYPLDGGRILISILTIFGKDKKKLLKRNKQFCFCVAILFFILFFVSLFFDINYNLLITGIFLIVNSFSQNSDKYFEKIKAFSKKCDKPLEVKKFRVSNVNKNELVKYLSPHYISVFEVLKDGKITVINEDDLIK